jgi:prepilin-type N-terminal cleavage/methylation domain-containing protein
MPPKKSAPLCTINSNTDLCQLATVPPPRSNSVIQSLRRVRTHIQRGFTLIELLVVIVIIGILATISVAQFSSYQIRARDTKRIQDINQIARLIQYDMVANAKSKYIESELSGGNICQTCASPYNTLLQEEFGYVPEDPRHDGTDYYYYFDPAHTCGSKTYSVIFAKNMEDPNNANADEMNIRCNSNFGPQGDLTANNTNGDIITDAYVIFTTESEF